MSREALEALDAQIDKLVAKRDDLKAKLERDSRLANLVVGTKVVFVQGRGEKRVEREGKIHFLVETPKGKLITVIFGEGAEERILPIDAAAITEVHCEFPGKQATASDDPLSGLI